MAQRSRDGGRKNQVIDQRSKRAPVYWIRPANPIRARGMGNAPHQRPDTCQHPTMRQSQMRNFLLRSGASTHVYDWEDRAR